MAIEVEQLKEEQRGLQVDFDKLAKKYKTSWSGFKPDESKFKCNQWCCSTS